MYRPTWSLRDQTSPKKCQLDEQKSDLSQMVNFEPQNHPLRHQFLQGQAQGHQ
jgi:hypothetical protein